MVHRTKPPLIMMSYSCRHITFNCRHDSTPFYPSQPNSLVDHKPIESVRRCGAETGQLGQAGTYKGRSADWKRWIVDSWQAEFHAVKSGGKFDITCPGCYLSLLFAHICFKTILHMEFIRCYHCHSIRLQIAGENMFCVDMHIMCL